MAVSPGAPNNPPKPGGATPPGKTPGSKPSVPAAGAAPKPGAQPPAKPQTSAVPKPNNPPAKPTNQVLGQPRPQSQLPSSASGRRTAADVAADRAKLGLSTAKPSEMIAGLQEVAKRAEKAEQREEAKRKSGGKMSANIALHVDDTGRRWAFQIKLGIAAALFLAVTVTVGLMILANRKSLSPREAAEQARRDLGDLASLVERMDRFDENDSITADKVKDRLKRHIDTELKGLIDAIAKEKKNNRPPTRSYLEQRDMLKHLADLKDPNGQPYQFKMDDDDNIAISTQISSEAIKPVVRRVRGGRASSAESSKTDDTAKDETK